MKLTKVLILSTLLLTSSVIAMTEATAADIESNASVNFITDAEPLRIDKTPVIEFGKQTISGSTSIYNARYLANQTIDENGTTKYAAPSVHIIDDRGTGEGWELQAKITKFETDGSNGPVTELEKALLSLTPTRSVKVENDPAVIPAGQQPLALSSTAIQVVKADSGKGIGASNYYFGDNADEATPEIIGDTGNRGNNQVTLTVPGESTKLENAQYVATLTWILQATP